MRRSDGWTLRTEQLAEDRARMKHRLPDDIAGVSIYVEDPEIRDDPKQAWLYFRERCRIAHVLEDNKRVLKEKYTEAKACGEKVNATRKAIAYLNSPSRRSGGSGPSKVW